MRKHWIDNLRWVTVLLFLLAGISARYALEKKSAGEWFKARTRKLLVPGTIGLFVFQWMTGYFNTAVTNHVNGASVLPEGVPGFVKYFAWSLSGIGPLWFIQLLWLLCLVLLLVHALDKNDRFWNWCGKAPVWTVILLGVLFWAGEQTLIKNPRPDSPDGLLNLYKPLFYLVPFLLGYFVFAHEQVQEKVEKAWIPLMGWFKARFDRTGPFATYMTRSSYGIYIVHYLVIASLGYMMKVYTQLPPWSMYAILTVAVFALSPALYELLKRIPVVKWCVLGE